MSKEKRQTDTSHDDGDDIPQSDDVPESFEKALEDTQRIVRQLESGQLSLEDSLQAYEQGVRRIRQCQQFLEHYEHKVELLTGIDKDGNSITEPFDEQEMTLEEKQKARGRRRGMAPPKTKGQKPEELF